MRNDHQAVRAAAGGGFVVIARDKIRDCRGEIATEGGAIRC